MPNRGPDRRQEERRKDNTPVAQEKRTGEERRTEKDRRSGEDKRN